MAIPSVHSITFSVERTVRWWTAIVLKIYFVSINASLSHYFIHSDSFLFIRFYSAFLAVFTFIFIPFAPFHTLVVLSFIFFLFSSILKWILLKSMLFRFSLVNWFLLGVICTGLWKTDWNWKCFSKRCCFTHHLFYRILHFYSKPNSNILRERKTQMNSPSKHVTFCEIYLTHINSIELPCFSWSTLVNVCYKLISNCLL